jgi:hypothetical protein
MPHRDGAQRPLRRIVAQTDQRRDIGLAPRQTLVHVHAVDVARATAMVSSAEVLIAHLRLAIDKMKRELYGARSERGRKLLDQMKLELEELGAG